MKVREKALYNVLCLYFGLLYLLQAGHEANGAVRVNGAIATSLAGKK